MFIEFTVKIFFSYFIYISPTFMKIHQFYVNFTYFMKIHLFLLNFNYII